MPPLRLSVEDVFAGVPEQELLRFAGEATVRPEGNVSENATPVSDTPALGLLTVTVSVDVPPSAILGGLNATETVGAEA